jgi:predicted enzyme related to lactoylglutathione lyase
MPNNVSHFAIEADDLDRARAFYENVFGWRFNAWGPPGFYLIHTGTPDDPGVQGALQGRREPLAGTGNRGFECTIGVDSLDAIEKAVKQHGGRITMPRVRIDSVGDLIYFEDTEGNRVGAMQYHPSYNFRGG